MKCQQCEWFRDECCVKIKEGHVHLLDDKCLLKHILNVLIDIKETLEDLPPYSIDEDGDNWKK